MTPSYEMRDWQLSEYVEFLWEQTSCMACLATPLAQWCTSQMQNVDCQPAGAFLSLEKARNSSASASYDKTNKSAEM